MGFGELLERSDYLSVHAPHNEETEHAIDAAALARMKPTAVVINTARGPIIDETALIEALQNGIIAGAGLDVLEQEPPSNNNPLLTMENVLVTPHVASATTRMRPETRRRVGREVALVLRGRWPMSCVNPTVLPRLRSSAGSPIRWAAVRTAEISDQAKEADMAVPTSIPAPPTCWPRSTTAC